MEVLGRIGDSINASTTGANDVSSVVKLGEWGLKTYSKYVGSSTAAWVADELKVGRTWLVCLPRFCAFSPAAWQKQYDVKGLTVDLKDLPREAIYTRVDEAALSARAQKALGGMRKMAFLVPLFIIWNGALYPLLLRLRNKGMLHASIKNLIESHPRILRVVSILGGMYAAGFNGVKCYVERDAARAVHEANQTAEAGVTESTEYKYRLFDVARYTADVVTSIAEGAGLGGLPIHLMKGVSAVAGASKGLVKNYK